jgi:electron transport complex protein RnfB
MELLIALVGGVAAVTGLAMTAHRAMPPPLATSDPLVDRIDGLLPQTQCRRCHYEGCRPYAAAIARGEAPINQCPPGGDATIHALADLLGIDPLPLNRAHGETLPPQVAVIEEERCIGCTKCIQACPVDAIVGAAKLMHTIIRDDCTGCELCLPPCPVDCIRIVPAPIESGPPWRAS